MIKLTESICVQEVTVGKTSSFGTTLKCQIGMINRLSDDGLKKFCCTPASVQFPNASFCDCIYLTFSGVCLLHVQMSGVTKLMSVMHASLTLQIFALWIFTPMIQ